MSKFSVENQLLIDGLKMYVDEQDSLGLRHAGIFEATETQLIKQHLKAGDVILDIGANIGYYSLIFCQRVGTQGHVYAFEPEAQNIEFLQHNIALNQFDNIDIIPKGVANHTGTSTLHLCPDNSGMHRAYPSILCQQTVEIALTRLDDYFAANMPPIDWIKMDIEGFEYQALLGMEKLIKAQKHLKILTEFSPAAMKEAGNDACDYLKLLQAWGFQLYSIDDLNTPLDIAALIQQVSIINQYLDEILSAVAQNKQDDSIQDIVIYVTEKCAAHGYHRPIFENFLCIKA